MTLLDLIDEVISSMAADGLSPFPGFFTLATIASAVLFRGREGKGGRDKFGSEKLSRRQVQEIKRILDDYFETKRVARKTYYGQRKRY